MMNTNVMNFSKIINLMKIMTYEHPVWSQKEKASNTRLVCNEKGGQNEPIQNYNDKAKDCGSNWDLSER